MYDMNEQTNKATFFDSVKKYFASLRANRKDRAKDEKKKVNPAVIVIIAAAALALAFMPTRVADKKDKDEAAQTGAEFYSGAEYTASMESELRDILSRISGAGEVSVRIYIDSTNEKVLAEESKTQSETSESGDSKTESSSGESQPAMSSGGSLGSVGEPYVVREKLPYPIGVIVVASGAADKNVKNEIYEAVKALYGLPANRIKVSY